MTPKTSNPWTYGAWLSLVVSLFFWHGPALAQGMPSLASLLAATPTDDWSMKMWRSLFGAFADTPFGTLGAPTTLLGGIFVIFNACIFAAGFTWALYGIVSAVAGTANDGEVLGRRMNTVWFPIRMIIGIAGMVPLFGGFTLTQAIMMLLTTVGIGIGNMMWTGAVNNTAQMQGLMQDQNISPANTSKIREAARSMFFSNVCVIAQGDHVRSLGGAASAGEQMRVATVTKNESTSYQYGSLDDPTKCGAVIVQSNTQARSANNILGFRSGAVNYDAIESAANNAYVSGLGTLQSNISTMATTWYQQRRTALDNGGVLPKFPLDNIEGAVDQFSRSATAAIMAANNNQGAIQADAKQNMLSVGWFGAGAWFSTFAEVNAAIADATKGPTVKANSSAGNRSTRADDTQLAIAAAETAYGDAQAERGATTTMGDPSKTIIDSAIRDTGCMGGGFGNAIAGTATNNCSLGQAVVSAAIKSTAIGSGGGGSGVVSNQGLVNPIIMMKNMGDYVMTFSSTILLGGWVAESAMWVAEKVGMGRVVSTVASAANNLTDKAAGSDGSFFAVIKSIAMVTLVLGAAMSIYIPLIPFITWMGAILAYAASMIEGLAGASLHAMSHLDGDGEGLGQRTTHGYMFYINAIARPALMIIGFFVASALMIAIGTLQAKMFLPAMANVQGNSVTGIFSIAMFLLVFFVMNLTLISASFNLIYVITDQVIGFIGGQIDSRLGRDTEDKVNNMFLMAARVGPSAIGQAGAASGAAKSDHARKLAAAAGGGSGPGGKPSGRVS